MQFSLATGSNFVSAAWADAPKTDKPRHRSSDAIKGTRFIKFLHN